MKIAVLGCGSIGKRHLANLGELGGHELGAFDPFAVPALPGVKALSSLREVWEWKPEVVLVAAPTAEHFELALAAARQGCHLFIEKPLSFTLDGIHELTQEIEKRGLISMVGCNMRFHFGPKTVHQQIESGVIGEILSARVQCGSFLPDWRPQTDYRQSYSASTESGGAILDCIHELDLALWHFGPAHLIAAAHLPARSIGLETDGLAELLLRHESGTLSSVHLNFVQRDYSRRCEIIGTLGTLRWEFFSNRVEIYGEDGELVEMLVAPSDYELNQMYLDEMECFLGAITTGQTAPNPVSEAAATLQIALEARRSGALP